MHQTCSCGRNVYRKECESHLIIPFTFLNGPWGYYVCTEAKPNRKSPDVAVCLQFYASLEPKTKLEPVFMQRLNFPYWKITSPFARSDELVSDFLSLSLPFLIYQNVVFHIRENRISFIPPRRAENDTKWLTSAVLISKTTLHLLKSSAKGNTTKREIK